jgi:hypothetical protein
VGFWKRRYTLVVRVFYQSYEALSQDVTIIYNTPVTPGQAVVTPSSYLEL